MSLESVLSSVAAVFPRVAILGIGLVLGFITLLPNVMMSDSGSRKATRSATIGMCASLAFGLGGLCGSFFNSWLCLLPGVLLQIAAFVSFS